MRLRRGGSESLRQGGRRGGGDRKSGGEGKRVEFGGGRIIKKKKNKDIQVEEFVHPDLYKTEVELDFDFLVLKSIGDEYGRRLEIHEPQDVSVNHNTSYLALH